MHLLADINRESAAWYKFPIEICATEGMIFVV